MFFGEYAPEGMHPAIYSAGYNASYIGVEAAMTVALLAIPAVHKTLAMFKTKLNTITP